MISYGDTSAEIEAVGSEMCLYLLGLRFSR